MRKTCHITTIQPHGGAAFKQIRDSLLHKECGTDSNLAVGVHPAVSRPENGKLCALVDPRSNACPWQQRRTNIVRVQNCTLQEAGASTGLQYVAPCCKRAFNTRRNKRSPTLRAKCFGRYPAATRHHLNSQLAGSHLPPVLWLHAASGASCCRARRAVEGHRTCNSICGTPKSYLGLLLPTHHTLPARVQAWKGARSHRRETRGERSD